MDIELEPGTYVVAVSGGVDSMVLLDLLAQQQDKGLKLIVAHLDHGIRADSARDRELVQAAAERYGLPFVYDEAGLGAGASEDAARKARYAFLERVKEVAGAQAIVTAHHQDDLLETAVLNMLRGTARRGLSSLGSHATLQRPLLDKTKASLLAYAKDQGLTWHEDNTNQDPRYLRNYIRHHILPRFSSAQKQELLGHIKNVQSSRVELEARLADALSLQPRSDELDRHWFIMLPHPVAREVLATWLRQHQIRNLSARMLERLAVAAKTYAPGSLADIDKSHVLHVKKGILALQTRER
jgi:tRNA(Ile)-lysidine synthase